MRSMFEAEFDRVDAAAWDAIVDRFADASIYQAWGYEAERSGERRMSHFVLRLRGEPVAAAQVRLQRLPLIGRGVAYVRWGPMWRRRGAAPDPAVLAAALQALRDEYAGRRRLVLRVLPHENGEHDAAFAALLHDAGWAPSPGEAAQRTLIVPLDGDPAALRRRLAQKWRNGLNQSERNGLEVETGDDDALFAQFEALHDEMHARKAFRQTSSVAEFRAVQRRLPPSQRMRIAIARREGRPQAGLVCSLIGDTGIYLFGATADAGMQSKASYLLQWQTLLWLKERGAASYNLHGINPVANPGTYHFKAGLAGASGRDLHYIGPHDLSIGAANRLLFSLANVSRLALRRARMPAARPA